MEASLFVVQQLGKNEYFACQLRKWTHMLAQNQEIPISMCGKHIKVKSLLDDEDIRHEI
ncbi:7727_t:CDS:1, partial [Funneliformis caledonium]